MHDQTLYVHKSMHSAHATVHALHCTSQTITMSVFPDVNIKTFRTLNLKSGLGWVATYLHLFLDQCLVMNVILIGDYSIRVSRS